MPTRRDFLTTGAAALAWTRLPRPGNGPSADLVLRRAAVFDGTGQPAFEADVAVAAGRITAVGARLADRGTEEIDLAGLALAPGFIDIHSHGDGSLTEDARAESVIRQGVTTIVVGQDGSSRRVGSFLDDIESRIRPAVNVASMVGLGSVRGEVVGPDDRPATADELARMVAIVEQALADGACGASTGLEYTPGGFATRDELIALSRPLAARRLPYSTHLRNEDDRLLDALDEAVAVAAGAGCPLQVAHLKAQGPRNWGRMDDAFGRIEIARRAGTDAAFDVYPYVAYQTGLTNLFPIWSRDGGTDVFLRRLDDPAVAGRIREETLAKVDLIGGWNSVLISGVRAPADSAVEGRRLGDLSAARAADPYQLTVELLRRSEGQVGMVGFAMSEENVERALAHPLSMVCSDGAAVAVDGPARRGHPHPRSLGSFPRVLGHYVRDRRVMPLAEAIHKMTARPAARVHVSDRGRIAAGLAADLVAFNPATVADRATYTDPFQYPAGIRLVLVNGAVTLRDGERTAARAGRGLRAG